MKPEEWVQGFAKELGEEVPSEDEFNAILDLAAVAAHSSERTAAPVAAYLAGRSGRSLADVQAIADKVTGG
jgi:Domain of unknown function (DUF6457)